MNILAVDTSTGSGSVALLTENKLLSEIVINSGANHSETILPAVEEVLKTACLDASGIDLYAVTTGPGSFTGLRIGISLVKGFALATGKPVVAVSTLEALACNCFASTKQICPILDAKRGQVYAALFEGRADGLPVRILPDCVEAPAVFLKKLRSDVVLVGDGCRTYAPQIDEMIGGRYAVAPAHQQLIRASSVGVIALSKYAAGSIVDPLTFAPVYIRASEVERSASLSDHP